MSDSVNILRSMESFDKAEQFDGFSKVVIIVSDEIEYSSGDDTGRTLTLNCPWGTQEIADNILQSIKGFQYQPMTANGALIDPSAEIGDGISANGIYSGIYSLGVKFNSNLPSDISAPSDEEIDEEFPYKSSQERKVERQNKEVRASLSIQADRITQEVTERQNQVGELRATLNVQAQKIEAKVSKEGGDASSFGWKLTATGWSVYGNGREKFRVDKNGAYVDGEIRATTGKIGNWDINSNSLSYNGQTWGGTNTTGAYIGQSGIQLGKNFKVDMQGNLTATGGTFDGIVKCRSLVVDGQTISPSSVRNGIGGGNSYASSGWRNYSASAVATNASNGNTALRVLEGTQYMGTINLRSGTFQMNGHNVYLGTIMVNGTQLKVLRWI